MKAGLAAFDSYFVSLFENESGSQVTKSVAYCGIMTSLESPLFTKRPPFLLLLKCLRLLSCSPVCCALEFPNL